MGIPQQPELNSQDITEKIGQTVVEETVEQALPGEEVEKPSGPSSRPDVIKDRAQRISGTLKNLKQAATKPGGPAKVTSSKVKTLILVGIILVSIGLLLTFIFSTFFGVLLMLVGAGAVGLAVYTPVK